MKKQEQIGGLDDWSKIPLVTRLMAIGRHEPSQASEGLRVQTLRVEIESAESADAAAREIVRREDMVLAEKRRRRDALELAYLLILARERISLARMLAFASGWDEAVCAFVAGRVNRVHAEWSARWQGAVAYPSYGAFADEVRRWCDAYADMLNDLPSLIEAASVRRGAGDEQGAAEGAKKFYDAIEGKLNEMQNGIIAFVKKAKTVSEKVDDVKSVVELARSDCSDISKKMEGVAGVVNSVSSGVAGIAASMPSAELIGRAIKGEATNGRSPAHIPWADAERRFRMICGGEERSPNAFQVLVTRWIRAGVAAKSGTAITWAALSNEMSWCAWCGQYRQDLSVPLEERVAMDRAMDEFGKRKAADFQRYRLRGEG